MIKIRVDNYTMEPSRIVAGTRGSYGIEQLEFEFGEKWSGLEILVSFFPHVGSPVSVYYTGEPIHIPAEVMACSGSSKFVVSGHNGEKTLITTEGIIRVIDTKSPADNPALLPKGDEVAQFMSFLAQKVNIKEGYGLSQNSFSDEEKEKLAGIEEGAQANIQSDWSVSDANDVRYIKNKPLVDLSPKEDSENLISSGAVFTALSGKAAKDHSHDGQYAEANHNHNGLYAEATHTHDGRYASSGHSHSGVYAEATHTHDGRYSLTSHNHSGAYAEAAHTHDGRYAFSNHSHSGIYAEASHNHTGQYAEAGHHHDSSYAGLVHNHDEFYAPRSGRCPGLVAGAAEKLVPKDDMVKEGIFISRETAGGDNESMISSARIKTLKGFTFLQVLSGGDFENVTEWETGRVTVGMADNICTVIPEPDEGNKADYIISIGESINIEGYDIWSYTCTADIGDIVEISELHDETGWNIQGLASGRVTLTISLFGEAVESIVVEVTSAPGQNYENEFLIGQPFKCINGHKYLVKADIETPGGGFAIEIDDGSAERMAVMAPRGSGWQKIAGVLTAQNSYNGKIALHDRRNISADARYSGQIISVQIDAETFARRINAYNPSFSGTYRFLYNSGWTMLPSGNPVDDIADFGLSVVWGESSEAERQGSEILVDFSYPYDKRAVAVISSSGQTGYGILSVDAGAFAGYLGSAAKSGSYVFRYYTNIGWMLDSDIVDLDSCGIYGTQTGVPQSGASITVELSLTSYDTVRLRNLMVFDLTYTGMDGYDVSTLEKMLGENYYKKGMHCSVFGGLLSLAKDGNEYRLLTENRLLRRLPNGTEDVIDFEDGVYIRKTASIMVSGSAGNTIMLHGAKSGTLYLSSEGSIGGISGNTLTLSASVNGVEVIYELEEPEITPLDVSGEYPAENGGIETVLVYNEAAGLYVPAVTALDTVISYKKDYSAQIEANKLSLLGILGALGIIEPKSDMVSEAAERIRTAIISLIKEIK